MSDHSEAAQQPVGLRAGEPRQREELREQLGGRRALAPILSWLTWWMLMMSFWVAIDDSLESDELLAGAGAAALAALAAEVITYQPWHAGNCRTANSPSFPSGTGTPPRSARPAACC
jgi:hypothetical protein